MLDRRETRYERIFDQLRELIEGRSPTALAAMATICALLHAKMPHHLWTGFYLVAPGDELHVGPYQGVVACQVLRTGGVCLRAVETKRPVIVDDVHSFQGHITCDPRAGSEIVIPVMDDGEVVAVLDIDAAERGSFSEADVAPLSRIVSLLDSLLSGLPRG
ncbi:MAG: GAF domain-containing protein [Candidatus Bipolaricaulota bacterium]|nr:MAG: GAF domain-containing protein [Candidatus Bipolaricaulota bacterium]